MDAQKAQPYSHSLIDAGVDWITATRPVGEGAYQFEDVQECLIDEQRVAHRDIRRATLRDYVGWRGQHLFVGMREQDLLVVASADVAARHWQNIAHSARNVSRLDLQASVWTHGEQPALARMAYQKLLRSPVKRGRPRSFTLIRTHPQGETLNVGKRQSDSYGRFYDWSSAHKQGQPCTIWRYEVEYKRRYASGHSNTLLTTDDPRTHIAHVVHAWWSQRGVRPTWSINESRFSNGAALVEPDRDALEWFRTSVSKTVRKAINRHGLRAVLDALNLSDEVQPCRVRSKANAFDAARTLPRKADR
jgi:hypothetical protein